MFDGSHDLEFTSLPCHRNIIITENEKKIIIIIITFAQFVIHSMFVLFLIRFLYLMLLIFFFSFGFFMIWMRNNIRNLYSLKNDVELVVSLEFT